MNIIQSRPDSKRYFGREDGGSQKEYSVYVLDDVDNSG